ncbi:NYN domain-containing protein [Corynebacterium sp. HMSC04H06]|uniref:NYN domain-containing protein n=1 Tax=Corynebacterium sp. HMSC04H06 TaxID=1581050 RepID=UPI0009F6F36C|nr:NYN domain-containing protein [Corynebacterium sp. HMSC04H06]
MSKNKRAKTSATPLREITTAVLVDGGFYRKRAASLFGHKEAENRAEELVEYCRRHIRESRAGLYRIYYYDCPPSEKVVYHPLLQKNVNLGQSELFTWTNAFFASLTKKRKVAIRRGEPLEAQNGYLLKEAPLKKLCRGKISVSDLTDKDFYLSISQKGVDMRIGLDIAALAERNLVNQIVMISGDSDFVPAAKHARRSGIDFILDPMWAPISDSLSEHIDGIRQCVNRPPRNVDDPLHVDSPEPENSSDDDDDEL